jgi:hypothetical protein
MSVDIQLKTWQYISEDCELYENVIHIWFVVLLFKIFFRNELHKWHDIHHHQWHHSPINEPWPIVVFFSLEDSHKIYFCKVRLSASRPTPNLEDQASIFITLRNRVSQLCPWTLGYLGIAISRIDLRGPLRGMAWYNPVNSLSDVMCLARCCFCYMTNTYYLKTFHCVVTL